MSQIRVEEIVTQKGSSFPKAALQVCGKAQGGSIDR